MMATGVHFVTVADSRSRNHKPSSSQESSLIPSASFFFCSSIHTSITFRIRLSLHCLRASSSLSISALINALELGESTAALYACGRIQHGKGHYGGFQ
jgi:hypothetical protein